MHLHMKVDGRCYCGDITFEAEIDPAKVELCHCTDCQRLSSSAFRIIVPAEPGSFRLLTGKPTVYVKTAESGNRRDQAFCPQCGTSIYSAPSGGKQGYFGLRVGALQQRDELIPHAQFWRRSAKGWVDDIAGLPKFETE